MEFGGGTANATNRFDLDRRRWAHRHRGVGTRCPGHPPARCPSIVRHRPGVGRLWPRGASRARALEPVARVLDPDPLRPPLPGRLWWRALHRALPDTLPYAALN